MTAGDPIDLVLATNNRDKVRELAHALHGLPLRLIPVAELGSWPEPEETGETLEANALLKARAALERTGRLCLADDTGLEVEALDGAPGVRSSRYAGLDASYAENVAKLLREMDAVPEERRRARFRCVVALVEPGGREAAVEGIVEGMILREPRGEGGFGYDPVFCVREGGRTFAEMGLEEKTAISHRGRALAAARRILESWYPGT
jgi:XTP/dITP diphosphohydrolase